jgi:putative oxidoreductase
MMATVAAIQNTPGKGKVFTSWVIRILLAVAFLGAGGAKLAGVPMMVEVFDQIGMGQWLRYVTALVEIAGAIALFVPALTAFAALGLAVTMFFAVLAHIFILPTPAVPALVLMVLALAVVWLHRDRLNIVR